MMTDTIDLRSRGKPAKARFLAAVLLGATGLLAVAACNGDSAASGVGGSGAMKPLLDEIDPGQSRLTFSGAVTSTGEYTTGEAGRYAGDSADVFQPARGGRADHARRGSNADGPYMFSILTDAIHQDVEDDVVRAWITVVLPEGAGPGAYSIASGGDAADDEAQASVAGDGYGWQFTRNIEGDLYIAQLGETLTAAWKFVAHDRAGEAVNVSGAVKDIDFTPQPEAEYVLSANGETVERFGRLTSNRRSNGSLTLLLGPGVYLDLPAGADEGAYPIRKRRQADSDITVTLSDYNFDEAEGELTLEREGDHYRGNYTVTATGEDDVELSGSFDRVTLADS